MTNHSARVSLRRVRHTLKPLALALLLVALASVTARAQWTTTNCGSNNVCSTNTGNVGVGTGTTAPSERLVVGGNMLGGQVTTRTKLYGTYDSQTNPFFELGAGTATSSITPYASFVLSKNLTAANNLVGAFNFANSSIADGSDKRVAGILGWTGQTTASGNLSFYTMGGGTFLERMRLDEGGNLGLGTATPQNQLHVDSSGLGGVRVSGVGAALVNFEDKGAATGQRLYQWRSEGGAFRMSLAADNGSSFVKQNILVANAAGNVGLGTGTPTARLHLIAADDSVAPALSVRQDTNPAYGFDVTLDTGSNGNLTLNRVNNGTSAAVLTFDRAGGNVGVGTTAPAAKLEVNAGSNTEAAIKATGTISATGAITGATVSATYQDVAEWVPSTQKLAAGTVVVLDGGRTNHVLASTTAYDTKVAGVISAEPGVILGVGGEGKVKVATTGRVRVKVDATRAPVRIGDLIVTSDVEGMAMRSEPISVGGRQFHAPGTIIGKALESLESGTGEILVLLSLQ